MKRIGALAGVGLLLAAVVVGTAEPGYAAPAKPNFATQARDAGERVAVFVELGWRSLT
jgi:hypothetical protein